MRLVRLDVEGLLGRFDHSIPFPDSWSFVILHGPNGVGKTRILELITATFEGGFSRLATMPFASSRFHFSDASSLWIARSTRQQSLLDDDESAFDRPSLRMELDLGNGTPPITGYWEAAEQELSPRVLRIIQRELPLERIERGLWRDLHFHEVLTADEIIERYGDYLNIELDNSRASDVPDEILDFLKSRNVHLIETQRLLIESVRPERAHARPFRHRSTVMHFSEDLTRRLREALATNSRRSQQLDRTFPRRVLEGPTPERATTERIQERYHEQTRLRQRLAEIAVLDAAPDLPLPNRELADWERRVLWTYLEDTEEKLSTFQGLLDRLDLLSQIVNSKFLYKDLHIDRDVGFRFEDDRGRQVPPSKLSSGEQHEIVLLYELLFNVSPGGLVLIDEPEISLHVSWQQDFLADLGRVAELASLRFIIATHSPQIINKWWDRTVALETLG